MNENEKTGKKTFEAMSEQEREIRIDLQIQLNKVKGRTFTKDQIDQEVALLLAGKPGRLLASHGDLAATPARESFASVQAREEQSQKLQEIQDRTDALLQALLSLPPGIDRGFATLRAELQIDLQQHENSILIQVKALMDQAIAGLLAKVKEASYPPAPPAKKEDKAAI